MGNLLTSSKEREPCLTALHAFLKEGAKIPSSIMKEGVNLVGFEDECEARQSTAFFHDFLSFLSRVGEHDFYFLWFPAGNSSSIDEDHYPIYQGDESVGVTSNFVNVQSQLLDEEILSSDAWFVTSKSALWAIYGEQYGSEMAILMSRSEIAGDAMMQSFPTLIRDPREALTFIGDQSATSIGERFGNEFLRNYQIS